MHPPLKKRIDSNLRPAQADSESEGLEEKAKLARHLHDQGVNPLRWTEAHPARQSDQQQFQETGRKPRDNQFEVGGRLYDWSPSVTATPAQAKAIADAFVATPHDPDRERAAPPIEEIVNVNQVPRKHPFGTPHLKRPANDMSTAAERTSLFRHYAQSGVDPDKAHLGDPLPMREQKRLKAEMAKLLPGDKTEISGLPVFYQGFDDGWIYQTNAHTRESEEVEKIRLAQAGGDSANDDAPELIEQIARHYLDRGARLEAASPAASDAAPPSEADRDALAITRLRNATAQMPQLIAIIRKAQAGEKLSSEEEARLADIKERFAQGGIVFEPLEANPDYMEDMQKAMQMELNLGPSADSTVPFHVAVDNLNVEMVQSLLGGTVAAARVARGMPLDRMKAIGRLVLDARLNLPAKALLTTLNIDRAMDGPVEMPDIFEDTGKKAEKMDVAIGSVEQGQQQKELTPATPKTLEALRAGLSDVRDFEVLIGGIPLFKQSEHKTLIDEIFRTELIKIAQEKGCLPDPNNPDDHRKVEDFGGTKPQKRITDIDQDGHLGSRQPDGGLRWQNPDDTWTEIMWNSTTPLADGFTEIIREWRALRDIIVKAGKHLSIGKIAAKAFTGNPVLGNGPLYHMAEKPKWSEQELRDFISKKLRERFDKDFKDCKFIGESRDIKIDHPDDPDLPLTLAR